MEDIGEGNTQGNTVMTLVLRRGRILSRFVCVPLSVSLSFYRSVTAIFGISRIDCVDYLISHHYAAKS